MKRHIFIFFILVGLISSNSPDLQAINSYVVTVIQPNPIKNPVIKWVSVTGNNKNEIAWQKQVNDNIVYYNVYRNASDNENTWELAGTVDYKSETYLNDLNSYANVQSYKYKIAAVDKCGNEIFSNTIVRSIYLTIKNSDGLNALQWTPYEGIKVNNYRILKGSTSDALMAIDSIDTSNTVYIDTNSNTGGLSYYQIEALSLIEDSTSQQVNKMTQVKAISNNVRSTSNIVSNTYDSILNPFENKNLVIYPNPLKSVSLVKFPYDPTQHYQMIILDLLGNTIKQSNVNSGEFLINNDNLAEGIYILKIVGRKSIQQKLIVGGKGL